MGGQYKFDVAFQHLKYCVDFTSLEVNIKTNVLQDIARKYIMIAELYLLGYGVNKDLNRSKELFTEALSVGYPAALLGLSRLEKVKRNYARSLVLHLAAYIKAAKLSIKDRNDPLLSGMGGKYRIFRRDEIYLASDEKLR